MDFLNKGKNLVIIIGAMKSGTTSLFKILSQHPEIIGTKKNETHFFSIHFDKGLDYYNTMWDTNNLSHNNYLFLEASPTYFKRHIHRNVAKRINKNYPEAKLICILRDPIDRLESNYIQYINDTGIKSGINNHLPDELIYSSMYSFQLNDYLKFFNKSNLKIIKTSDLNNSPKKIFDEVCSFLDIKNYNFKNLSVKYGNRKISNTYIYQKLRKIKIFQKIVLLLHKVKVSNNRIFFCKIKD